MLTYLLRTYLNKFGHLVWPFDFQPYLVKHVDKLDIASCLQPGDLLLTFDSHYVDNQTLKIFSKAEVAHAAIYVGEYADCKQCVIEAVTPCVRAIHLFDFLNRDTVYLIKPGVPDLPKQATLDAIVIAKEFEREQTPYDVLFDFDDTDKSRSATSCSELVYRCYEKYNSYLQWTRPEVSFLRKKYKVFPPQTILDIARSNKGTSFVYKSWPKTC